MQQHVAPQPVEWVHSVENSASPVSSRIARLGHAMRKHRRVILGIQWGVVIFYLALVTIPAFLPLPPSGASILNNLTLFAQFLFWGIWWPFVMISMMLMGRVWCGVFCPEGALTEFVSRRGLGKAIPRWLRWSGWPPLAFISTTLYGQLVSVYEYPQAALLILGGSTLGAMAVGFIYGKGKRVWCRTLCPANGVFALLAKVAPIHFRTHEANWKNYPLRTRNIDCAPLVDLRHMQSASECHACGRCSGHRDAIALTLRSPNQEILALEPNKADTGSALTLIFGVLGVALGAFQWTMSPWFVAMKQACAEWLVDHNQFALLQDNAPWWLLTHYPAANDVFSWLDGLCIIAYIFATAALIGGSTFMALRTADKLGRSQHYNWKTLAMALVPLGGISIFLGLSMLTLTHLHSEGFVTPWLDDARAVLLAGGVLWSATLGGRIIFRSTITTTRKLAALLLFTLPLSLVSGTWILAFYIW